MMKYKNLTVAGVDYQTLQKSLANTDFITGIDFTDFITYTDIQAKNTLQKERI